MAMVAVVVDVVAVEVAVEEVVARELAEVQVTVPSSKIAKVAESKEEEESVARPTSHLFCELSAGL